MNPNKRYLSNGWGALDGALVFCPSQVPLPITRDELIAASQLRWPGGRARVRIHDSNASRVSIDVHPENDYPFLINLYDDGVLMSMDGLPEQNLETVVWLRSLMPKDAPRMVVSNSGFDTHAELPFGVTVEEIATRMVDHTVDGWNDGDPEFEWA